MTHEKVQKENIIEKYVRQQLTPDDENGFEEHLLFCSACRTALQELEDIIEAIRLAAREEGKPEKAAKKLKWRKNGRIISDVHLSYPSSPLSARLPFSLRSNTAVLARFAALCAFFLLTIFCLQRLIPGFHDVFTRSRFGIQSDPVVQDLLQKHEDRNKALTFSILAHKSLFTPNPVLEDLLFIPNRSVSWDLTLLSPAPEEILESYLGNVNLSFKGYLKLFGADEPPAIRLQIFSNRRDDFIGDKPLFSEKIKLSEVLPQKFTFKTEPVIDFSMGLFYFILTEEQYGELLHAGKFYVIPSARK